MSGRPNSSFTCLSLPSPSSLPAALSPMMTPVVKFTFDHAPDWLHSQSKPASHLKSSLKRPKLDSISVDRSPSKKKVRFSSFNMFSQQILRPCYSMATSSPIVRFSKHLQSSAPLIMSLAASFSLLLFGLFMFFLNFPILGLFLWVCSSLLLTSVILIGLHKKVVEKRREAKKFTKP